MLDIKELEMKNSDIKLERCPLCDGILEVGETEEIFEYRGKKITVKMQGEHCRPCNEGFQNNNNLKINDHNIELAKLRVDKERIEQMKQIRKKLNLTQEEAGKVFGGGIRAFNKYENEKIKPPKSLDILMDLLQSEKITLKEIISMQMAQIA